MSFPTDSMQPTGNVNRKPSVTFQEQNRPSRPTSHEDLRGNKGQHFGFSRHHSSDNLSQDVESGRSGMARKKSLVRPERERIDPNLANGTIAIMLHKWTRIETLMSCICLLRLVSYLSMELCPPDQVWQASWDLVVV